MSKNRSANVLKNILPAFLLSAGILSAILFPPRSGEAISSSSAGAELGATVVEYIRIALDTNSVALKDGDSAVVTPSVSGTLATGNLNVAVTTNTTKGFSLAVHTQDDTTTMTHSGSNTTSGIASISGASGYDVSTGAAELAADTWGFRKKTGADTYGNWFGVGADEAHGTVIENTNSSNSEYCNTLSYPLENSGCSSNTYAEHTLNFGANLTSSLPAGTYANNVVFSAVAKSEGTTYTINFDANGGTGQMGTKSIVAGSTFTMPANTLITNEYPFLGYSFDANARTATYEPGDIVTVNDFLAAASAAGQDIDNALTLYLIWEKPLVAMQDFDCSSLSANEITTLVDSRDNHEYKVKKLPDGKCWMINNLTLTATDLVTEGKALTSANTNIPSSDTNSYYITPKNARYTSTGSFNNSAVASASASVNFSSSYPDYIQIGYRDKNTTDNDTGNPVPEDTVYYSFYTATLGYSYSGDGKTSGSSTMDICPKGWRLPKVSDNGTSITAASSEFANLARSYNSNASWTNANTSANYYTPDTTIRQNMIKGDASSLDPELDTNGSAGFTYAGYHGSSTLNNIGTSGGYWSSSVYNSNYGYYLGFNTSNSNVFPQGYGYKYRGYAVRCVAN